MHFACTSEKTADAVVVTPIGEIDRDTAPRLREVLEQAVQDAAGGTVEVDMANVSFMDSSGIGALLAGHQQAGSAGGTFRLRNPSEAVRSVLEITNVWRILGTDRG
jgi:anti-sigma B factor antagonist